MYGQGSGRLRLTHPRRGVLQIEVRHDARFHLLAWCGLLLFTLWAAFAYSTVFLLLPALCLLFEARPCLRISSEGLNYGTSFLGWFFENETVPLRAIREIRVQELRYRQWGLYRGPENDANAGSRGRNCAMPYLVLDEGVAEIKLALGLSEPEYEWLADYIGCFVQHTRLRPTAT